MWWNGDRLAHGYDDYWNAPIFHPSVNSLTFSEPMPLSALTAPLYWATGNLTLSYNVWLLAVLTLNGWSGFQLLRQTVENRCAAFVGGGLVVLLPFVQHQFGVAQLVPLFGILWSLAALRALARNPTLPRGVVLGLCVGLTYWLCNYYGLFLGVLLAASFGWLFKSKLRSRKVWESLGLSALVATIVVSPIVVAQFKSLAGHARPRATVQQFSASPRALVALPWPATLPQPVRVGGRHEVFPAFPGVIKLLLAVIGVGLGLRRPAARSWTQFCVALLIAALILGMGTRLQVGGWSVYGLLANLPGFAQIRSPLRFLVFAQLMSRCSQLKVCKSFPSAAISCLAPLRRCIVPSCCCWVEPP